MRALLRDGADDDVIADRIATIWGERDDRYSEQRASASATRTKVEMSHIGG